MVAKGVRHLLTATEAVRTLGIPLGTIRSWRGRGRLVERGLDERKRPMYAREHLIELRDKGRVYRAEQGRQRERRRS